MNTEAFHRRLTARAARAHVTLTSRELDQLWIYYELLNRWNRRINLTGLQLEPLNDPALDRLLPQSMCPSTLLNGSIWALVAGRRRCPSVYDGPRRD